MPISWYLLAFILDFDPIINKALIIMLITDPLRTAELSCLYIFLAFTQNNKFSLLKKLILLLRIANFLEKIGQIAIIRSSRSQMFFKIGVLKNFAIFIGKHLVGICKCNFITKKLRHRFFSANIAKFLRTAFCIVFCCLFYILPNKLSLNWHFIFEIIISQVWLLTPYIRGLLRMSYSV